MLYRVHDRTHHCTFTRYTRAYGGKRIKKKMTRHTPPSIDTHTCICLSPASSHPCIVETGVWDPRQEQGRRGEHGRPERQPVMLLETPLKVVLRAVVLPVRGLAHLQEPHQKSPRRRHRQLELEAPQYRLLHLENLVPRVGVVRDVHAVPYLLGCRIVRCPS